MGIQNVNYKFVHRRERKASINKKGSLSTSFVANKNEMDELSSA